MALSKAKITPQQRKGLRVGLISAAKAFHGENAVESFIDSVLTDGERMGIARRITVAKYILAGHKYMEINEELHISPNTYSKINKWLEQQMPDYEKVLKECEQESAIRGKRKKRGVEWSDPFSFKALRKRYPMHFLLFNLFIK